MERELVGQLDGSRLLLQQIVLLLVVVDSKRAFASILMPPGISLHGTAFVGALVGAAS